MKLNLYGLLALMVFATAANAETYTYGFEQAIDSNGVPFQNFTGQNSYLGIADPVTKVLTTPTPLSAQTINFDAATFSGGGVLTDAIAFPAHTNFFPNNLLVDGTLDGTPAIITNHNAYGTSNMGNGLSNTIAISLLPDFHASAVSFTLFNGETNIQDYTVSAFNGTTLLGFLDFKNLEPNIAPPANSSKVVIDGADSYAIVDLRFTDITNVTISFLNDPASSKFHPDSWDFLIDDVTFTGTGGQGIYPVPEPETYAMMLVGLGLMGYIGRRRKNNI
ncbi:MAG: PEP-CTERM sorting domain-containing protein [Methylophilaceae bacterium]